MSCSTIHWFCRCSVMADGCRVRRSRVVLGVWCPVTISQLARRSGTDVGLRDGGSGCASRSRWRWPAFGLWWLAFVGFVVFCVVWSLVILIDGFLDECEHIVKT